LARPYFKTAFNFVAVLCLWSTSGLAASISLSPLDDDSAHALVAVEGTFEADDHIKFRTQVGRLTKAIVVLSSDGGNLLAGIEIGKTIRLKSFATAVLDGFRCASSCAFAWLGGSPRYMERGAQIGFHAAYVKSEGRASESGVGNALVGSYLTQIGLSENAVVYITQAAPHQMTWLTLPDAKQVGIEVVPWEFEKVTTKPTQPSATPRNSSDTALSSRAQSFVSALESRWWTTNDVEWLGPLYADEVNFNGKMLSRSEVLTAHRLFFERWPERSYKVQDKSMNAACGEVRPGLAGGPVECTVTGTEDFAQRSIARNAAMSGVGSFTYVLRASKGTFIIKGQQGSILQRRQ
jgi:hypothetical protein